MPPTPPSPDLLAALPGITARLVAILANLAALIARALLRHPTHVVHIVPLWNYIGRTSRRFQALASRLAAGQLRPRTPRPGRKPGKPPGPRGFPTTRAWLLAALRHEAAAYGSQLTHLLEQPDGKSLLQAAPQAARLLRPICHMLGFMPEPLRPSPRPRIRRQALPTPARQDACSAHGAPGPAQPTRPPAQDIGALASWCSSAPAARQPGRRDAPAPSPPQLCPRLLDRWPFNQLARAHPA